MLRKVLAGLGIAAAILALGLGLVQWGLQVYLTRSGNWSEAYETLFQLIWLFDILLEGAAIVLIGAAVLVKPGPSKGDDV